MKPLAGSTGFGDSGQGGNTFTLEQNDAPDQLPEEARKLGDDGFIGRQQPVQQLERARLRQPQAAFLIHGMAGVGKTTLAKGFLHWLRDTGGLDQQVEAAGLLVQF